MMVSESDLESHQLVDKHQDVPSTHAGAALPQGLPRKRHMKETNRSVQQNLDAKNHNICLGLFLNFKIASMTQGWKGGKDVVRSLYP